MKRENESPLNNAQNANSDPPNGTTARKGSEEIFDLCCEGAIDCCREMLAEKIMAPSFWSGAERFVAQPTPIGGRIGVRNSLCQYFRHFFGVSIRKEHIQLIPNEFIALELFARSFCSDDDVILCPAPFSDPRLPLALTSGNLRVDLQPIQLENSPLLSINDLQKAVERLEKKGRRVRALLLHNPHPILSWIGDGQRRLAHILEWAAKQQLFLLVDESLASLDLWEFSSCLGLDHIGGRLGNWLVWIWSGAKHFSLPGLEFAAVLFPQADPPQSELHLLPLRPCAPLVQYLTAKLFDDFEWNSELFARRKSRLEGLRRNTLEGLSELGLLGSLVASEQATPWLLANLGTFLGDFTFESERSLREEFIKKAGLALNSGEQLGMAEPGWFRIRVASSGSAVADVLHRLRKVLAGRKESKRERMDMGKYGGITEVGWEDKKRKSELIREEQDGENEDERKEEKGREEIEVGEWKGKNEVLEEKDKMKRKILGEQASEVIHRKEEDEIIDLVFSIFPEERLHLEEPLAEVYRKEDKGGRFKEKKLELRRTAEMEYMELEGTKKTKEENGREVSRKEAASSSIKTTLDDLSFIERLIYKTGNEEEHGVEEGAYYDEVSTEEEGRNGKEESRREDEENRVMGEESRREDEEKRVMGEESEREGSREEERSRRTEEKYLPPMDGNGISREYDQMLSIEVPAHYEWKMKVEEEEEDERNSKRIINIIDQIFHESVQIREYSDEPSGRSVTFSGEDVRRRLLPDESERRDFPRPHPQQRKLWARSDSGLASESPPDAPEEFTHYHNLCNSEHISAAGDERFHHSLPHDLHPGNTSIHSQDSALFSEMSPLYPQSGGRNREFEYGEGPQKVMGPTEQRLDDSGIFVDLPMGALSIDFPLLVPREQLRKGKDEEEEEEEDSLMDGRRASGDEDRLRVELHFKTVEEENARGTSWHSEKESDRMTDPSKIFGKDRFRLETRNGPEELGWSPMEDVESEASRFKVDYPRMGSEEKGRSEETEGGHAEDDTQHIHLASLLNEGSIFCPKTVGEKISRVEVRGEEEVMMWTPMDQLEDEGRGVGREEEERAIARMEEEREDEGKKFSEELKESQNLGITADVVIAEWNSKVMNKAEESEEVEVEVELNKEDGRERKREEWSEVSWKGEECNNKRKNWEEKPEEQKVAEGLWRDRWRAPEIEREQWKNSAGMREKKEELSIPGRTRYWQVHQRMQMGRRLGDDLSERSSKYRPQDAIVLEHMNITEMEYVGKGAGGEQLQTSISTRINRWTRDEWFRKVPTEENLEEMLRMEELGNRRKGRRDGGGRERVTKVVEVRGRRERGRGDEIASIEESEQTVIRRVDLEDETDGGKGVQTERGNVEVSAEGGQGAELYRWEASPRASALLGNRESRKRVYSFRETKTEIGLEGNHFEAGTETAADEPPAELHSEFETIDYEWQSEDELAEEKEGVSIARTRHRTRRQKHRRTKAPERISVSTTVGGRDTAEREGREIRPRISVRHTPGSRWIVSSVYRTTDWGWEKTSLE